MHSQEHQFLKVVTKLPVPDYPFVTNLLHFCCDVNFLWRLQFFVERLQLVVENTTLNLQVSVLTTISASQTPMYSILQFSVVMASSYWVFNLRLSLRFTYVSPWSKNPFKGCHPSQLHHVLWKKCADFFMCSRQKVIDNQLFRERAVSDLQYSVIYFGIFFYRSLLVCSILKNHVVLPQCDQLALWTFFCTFIILCLAFLLSFYLFVIHVLFPVPGTEGNDMNMAPPSNTVLYHVQK